MDKMKTSELAEVLSIDTILIPGNPYLFLMAFGWGKVAYFVKYVTPNRILVAHVSHFRNANTDYGRLMTQGAGPECEWRYEGKVQEINLLHCLTVGPYNGTVHRGYDTQTD